jgi:zinc/manganese transport system substrate-binding protein
VPKEKRVIITSHDALGYLGDAYGITILPAAGLSTMNDTSAKATAALISQARAAGTKAMFLENIGNAKMLESIAKELGTAPTGKLYTDALSATGPATTYADLFRYNVMTIAGAMGK